MNDNELHPGERLVEGQEAHSGASEEGRVTAIRRNEQVISYGLDDGRTLAHLPDRTELDRLTLHEERAQVEVVREQVGSVSVRKVIRERQETLPVTLTTEVLEITVQDGAGKVTLNGEVLEPGRSYEVVIHDERAVVQKQVFVQSDVTLAKLAHTYTHTEQVALRREELDVRDPQGLVREVEGG